MASTKAWSSRSPAAATRRDCWCASFKNRGERTSDTQKSELGAVRDDGGAHDVREPCRVTSICAFASIALGYM